MIVWLTVSFIVTVIFGIIIAVCKNEILTLVSLIMCVGGFLSLLSAFCVVMLHEDEPEVRHEKLLRNLDDANKELQKFYIDHPEFKEEQE